MNMNNMGKLFLSALSVLGVAACAVSSTDEAVVLGESQEKLTGPNGFGFFGSDTLRPAIVDALIAWDPTSSLTYYGSGSSNGEKCMRGQPVVYDGVTYCNGTKDQGIAAMSRALKTPLVSGEVNHCIAKDAVAFWYTDTDTADDTTHDLMSDAFCGTRPGPGVKRNGTGCTVDTWGELDAGASNPSNNLRLFRRDDKSGTTEVFKEKSDCDTTIANPFCPGIQVVEDGGPGVGPKLLSDAANTSSLTGVGTPNRLANCPASPICAVSDSVTVCLGKIATCDDALVYAGLEAENSDNQAFEIDSVPPTDANIRSGAYYYARFLYLNEGSGTKSLDEADFLDWALILDPQAFEDILVNHDFIACTDPSAPGHQPLDCSCP
ncbi:substrate-binding domain-containing protein [Sorangium sp. So ce134]